MGIGIGINLLFAVKTLKRSGIEGEGTDGIVVEFPPVLDAKLRIKLAELIVEKLNL